MSIRHALGGRWQPARCCQSPGQHPLAIGSRTRVARHACRRGAAEPCAIEGRGCSNVAHSPPPRHLRACCSMRSKQRAPGAPGWAAAAAAAKQEKTCQKGKSRPRTKLFSFVVGSWTLRSCCVSGQPINTGFLLITFSKKLIFLCQAPPFRYH